MLEEWLADMAAEADETDLYKGVTGLAKELGLQIEKDADGNEMIDEEAIDKLRWKMEEDTEDIINRRNALCQQLDETTSRLQSDMEGELTRRAQAAQEAKEQEVRARRESAMLEAANRRKEAMRDKNSHKGKGGGGAKKASSKASKSPNVPKSTSPDPDSPPLPPSRHQAVAFGGKSTTEGPAPSPQGTEAPRDSGPQASRSPAPDVDLGMFAHGGGMVDDEVDAILTLKDEEIEELKEDIKVGGELVAPLLSRPLSECIAQNPHSLHFLAEFLHIMPIPCLGPPTPIERSQTAHRKLGRGDRKAETHR